MSFLLLAFAFYYWWRGQQIKEKAFQAVMTRCYELDLELLDSNIALVKQGFSKDKNGRKHWLRHYQF
ncbi:MAG: DUF3301 domain-containing protein, partial [Kangiellaceae bacterium]|nr:DUF3301 domain-containing protein [Kangiellaceae bacterium]